MKKILVIMMLLLVLVGCNKESVVEEDVMSIAIKFNEALVAKNYEVVQNDFEYDEALLEFMTVESLTKVFNDINVGDVVNQEEPYEMQKDIYTIVVIPTVYENASYDINIVFNEEKIIAGFNLGPYSGMEEAIEDTLAIEDIAQAHFKDLDDENYEALMAYDYGDEVAANITEAFFEEVRKQLVFDKIVETKTPFTYKIQGYDAVAIPVVNDQKSFNYELVFDENKIIVGIFSKQYQEKDVQTANIDLEAIQLDYVSNDGVTLPGILTKPLDQEKSPCVILVHGSGPADKDETVYQNKPFRDIAEGLASLGVATYRYDKRTYVQAGVFASDKSVTVYDEVINDVEGIVKMISARDDVSEVIVLGHSLGGYLVPRINEVTEADGYIIMAGLTRSIQEAVIDQFEYLTSVDGTVTDAEALQVNQVKAMFEKLENIDTIGEDEVIFGAYKTYWADLQNYKPVEEAKGIEAPVLVLQGERDYQVTVEDYNNWLALDLPHWTYKLYPALNHLMMPGEGKSINTEYAILNKVDEELIEDIANWVKGL